MQTSNFHTSSAAPGAIAICRGLPRWIRFHGAKYQALAPTWPMLKMARPDYDRHFDEILALLDPMRVWDELHALVPTGAEPVLLCHEKPFHWCHRRRVAEWLEERLCVTVSEVGYLRAAVPAYAEMQDAPAKRKHLLGQPTLFGLFF